MSSLARAAVLATLVLACTESGAGTTSVADTTHDVSSSGDTPTVSDVPTDATSIDPVHTDTLDPSQDTSTGTTGDTEGPMPVGQCVDDCQQPTDCAIMDPAFQSAFNVVKGSVPARTDVPNDAFDDCGKKAIKDVAEANKNNTLVGSIAHGHAVPASIKNAFYDVITRHFNGQIDDKKAVAEMVAAAKN